MKHPAVYIMTNQKRGTLYTGVTSDLPGRVYQHREGLLGGFTKVYGLKRLVWCDVHGAMASAIQAEKRIKRWRRLWKIALIERANPDWRDLWFELLPQPSSRKAEGLSGTQGLNFSTEPPG
ncbi:MAG: GIY-YIG nuclease family protein [Pseudomonadota bacterium]